MLRPFSIKTFFQPSFSSSLHNLFSSLHCHYYLSATLHHRPLATRSIQVLLQQVYHMARFDTYNEPLILPERGITLPAAVDASLRDRVRSLLASRNERNPPRTPCSSPDREFLPRLSEENLSTPSFSSAADLKVNATLTWDKLSYYEDRSSSMGITKFDGPAGQLPQDSNELLSRRSSQPSMYAERKSSDEWPRPLETPGLNQRSQGDVLGMKASVSTVKTKANPYASKKSTESKIPRFHLRTVPPAVNVNKTKRPGAQHVPGSYQSEVNVKGEQSAKAATTLKNDLLNVTTDVEALPFNHHCGPNHERHTKAVDVLHHVAEHDRTLHKGQHPSSGIPLVQEGFESTSIAKTDSLQEGLWRPLDSYEDPDSGAYINTRLDELQVPTTKSLEESQPFIVGSDDDEKADGNINLPVQTPAGPATSQTAKEAPEQLALRTMAEDTDISHKLVSIQSASTYQADVHRYGEAETTTSTASSQPKETQIPKTLKDDIADDDSVPFILPIRDSPQIGTKPSPITRALSMLSEISARTMGSNPSTRSSARYEKLPSLSNLTTRSSHRPKYRMTSGEQAQGMQTPINGSYQALADKHGGSSTAMEYSAENAAASPPRKTRKESITRVITDLEKLLKEALNIAGQASYKDESETALITPKAQRTKSRTLVRDKSSQSSLSEGDQENMQARLTPQEHEDEALFHDQSKKNRTKTPYPVPTEPTSYKAIGGEQVSRTVAKRSTGILEEVPLISAEDLRIDDATSRRQAFNSADWAVRRVPSQPSKLRTELKLPPIPPQKPGTALGPSKEQHSFLIREHGDTDDDQSRNSIRNYVHAHQRPPVQPRLSSMRLRSKAKPARKSKLEELEKGHPDDEESDCDCVPYVADFRTSGIHYHPVYQVTAAGETPQPPKHGPFPFPREDTVTTLRHDEASQFPPQDNDTAPQTNTYSLEGRHHFSVREPRGFSMSKSHRRSPIARDWSTSRKRFTAAVTCITTAFIGLIIGIYAGEVPAIQYAIADEHHYTILGNVLFFIGLAITTALFYPLPLLHGRKPYTLAALAILLPLQFPQALVISGHRSPYVATYRLGLLLPRFFAGLIMGFANINLKTTLLDLFGSSLQSGNPHQEAVNENDVRRHGGGMGVWLGIWTWCSIGSIGVGFLIGAGIISGLNVSWGFWILIILNAIVLVLNILTPEVRRSAFRRSMAEVRTGSEVSRRVARGEIKMHLESTGPIWWGQEVFAGHVLAIRMLKQPGFAILSLYLGWIYGQVVIVVVVSNLNEKIYILATDT